MQLKRKVRNGQSLDRQRVAFLLAVHNEMSSFYGSLNVVRYYVYTAIAIKLAAIKQRCSKC